MTTDVARQKYVTLGQLDDGLRVIKDGLRARRPRHRQRPDARARPGQKVTPQEQGAPRRLPAGKAVRPSAD